RSSMRRGFLPSGDGHGPPTEFPRDSPRDSHRLRFAFNRKDSSFERWHSDTTEGLQRMHRSDNRPVRPQGFKGTGVTGAAGMQNNSPTQFSFTVPFELSPLGCNLVIRRGDQDNLRQEDLTRQSRPGLPCPNEMNGASRACLAAGNYRS